MTANLLSTVYLQFIGTYQAIPHVIISLMVMFLFFSDLYDLLHTHNSPGGYITS